MPGYLVEDVDSVKDLDQGVLVRHVDHVFHPGLHLGEAPAEGLDLDLQPLLGLQVLKAMAEGGDQLHRTAPREEVKSGMRDEGPGNTRGLLLPLLLPCLFCL